MANDPSISVALLGMIFVVLGALIWATAGDQL